MLRIPLFLMLNLLAATMMVGCASLSKNECLEADWYEIGYVDGKLAKDRSQLQRHVKACNKHGVRADRTAYNQGRREGLKLYCTSDNGYVLGKDGNAYKHVCPPDFEPAFRSGYDNGLERFWFESGYLDGNKGKSLEAYQHRLSTGRGRYLRHNQAAYDKGRLEGLKLYCTPEKGYELGKQGRAYNPVCPRAFERDFLDAYNSGKELFNYHKDLARLEQQLVDVNALIKEKERALVAANLPPRQRMKLRQELKALDLEYRDLERELMQMRQQGGPGYAQN